MMLQDKNSFIDFKISEEKCCANCARVKVNQFVVESFKVFCLHPGVRGPILCKPQVIAEVIISAFNVIIRE